MEPSQEKDPQPRMSEVLTVKDRLTVLFTATHEHPGDDPTQIERHWADILETQEQVYTRRCKATAEWKRLDIGWFDNSNCGMIIIQNLTPVRSISPSPEELAEEAKQELWLRFNDKTPADLIVPVGKLLPIYARRPDQIQITTAVGEKAFRVTVFPR